MTKKEFSIYVHIPFCISKCAYCAFYSEKYDKEESLKYVNALKKAITYFSDLNDVKGRTVKTIYFGGGTPTAIGAELLCDTLEHIKKCFDLSRDCEITFEANPKTVSFYDALKLKDSGFNRVSLGIQTTNNERLKMLGRIHTWEDAVSAYKDLKNAGFSNISVDIMYALPNTKIEDLFEDIKNISYLEPSHISAYALSLEEGTPLFNSRKNYVFPDDETQLEMYLSICEKLSELGFSHYEISNFSRPSMESCHNKGYWTRRNYIGFGSGAHSLWDNKRFYSISNRKDFIKLIEASKTKTAIGLDNYDVVSGKEILEEEIMLSLRTSTGINLKKISPTLERFVKEGLATFNEGVFSLTDKGFFVSNSIIYYVCKELIYDS